MTKAPSLQEFKVTIDQDPAAPKVSVQDLTADGAPSTLAHRVDLPLFLSVDHHAGSQADLVVRLAHGAFDPERTKDENVLDVTTHVADRVFGTQDDTKYIVRLTNSSRYYVAEDIHVVAELVPEKDQLTTLPDGNLLLSLLPRDQHVACIGPGRSADVTYVAISRGPAPGLYPVRITLRYRLLYWDGRVARAVAESVLPVQSPDYRWHLPDPNPAVPMPRQPSSQRSQAMPDVTPPSAFFPPARPQPPHRKLEPIELRIDLPGGGHLEISYRLTKNTHPDPAHRPGCYGINPETHSVESYFSTIDTAALEVSLRNASPHDLRHVRLSSIHVVPYREGGERQDAGPPPPTTLPDGNLIFEVAPSEVYFGHIPSQHQELRYLSLITRGTAPGRYAVHMTTAYDIEASRVPVKLWLQVNED